MKRKSLLESVIEDFFRSYPDTISDRKILAKELARFIASRVYVDTERPA